MDELQRLRDNIRILRQAYGETQEQLGKALGNMKKNTVSSYENGTRRICEEVLSKIANHYMVPVDLLLHADLSDLKRISFDPTAFVDNLDKCFPIVQTDEAMQNEHFRKAYRLHQRMYEKAKGEYSNSFRDSGACLDEYDLATQDVSSEIESTANSLALLYIGMAFMKSTELWKSSAIPVSKLFSNDPGMKIGINAELEKNADDLSECQEMLYDKALLDMVNEMRLKLKRSSQWADLADYYLALQYVYSIVHNSLPDATNRTIGTEMIQSLISAGNPYAKQYWSIAQQFAGQINTVATP